MNESMNFGNIGFSNVSSDKPASQEPETKAPEQPKQPSAIDLMAGVREAREEEERKRLEEEQAIKDFQAAYAKKSNFEKDADNFSQIDFGPLKKYLDDDDITDISYSNNGQLWLKSLEKGVYRADQQEVNNELIEKIAFQCSNVMGKTFNMAHPFLDSESAELRMNFVHDSIARNGIAVVFRKTPAKIRLEKQKLLNEKYIQLSIHDFLINCVKGHCNIIVCGETGSGKTELVKYLASHTRENEKIITIEDTLELHLDRIYPHRDIVAMKTNNIASYSDVLVTCMRQNPIWILLSEVRSAEAVTAVRNSISSGHYILSTIHADKAESIPHRMYSLLESNIDVEQFLKTIYRYVQIGVFVRGRYKPEEKRFVREIAGVCEFFVTEDTNEPKFNNIYLKTVGGEETYNEPTKYIKNYLEGQGVDVTNLFGEKLSTLAQANEANGIESDVKELDGEIIHTSGNHSGGTTTSTPAPTSTETTTNTATPVAETPAPASSNPVTNAETAPATPTVSENQPSQPNVETIEQKPAIPPEQLMSQTPQNTVVAPVEQPQAIVQSVQPAQPVQPQVQVQPVQPVTQEAVAPQNVMPVEQLVQTAPQQVLPTSTVPTLPQNSAVSQPAIVPQSTTVPSVQPNLVQPVVAETTQNQVQVGPIAQPVPQSQPSKFFSGIITNN